MKDTTDRGNRRLIWLARIGLGLVFFLNIECAFVFLAQPDRYAGSFELTGITGRLVIQSFAILFLMWNCTYPPVLLHPERHGTLFAIILAQQLIGLTGETWLWLQIPTGHLVLSQSGLRFILFDAAGFFMMSSVTLLFVRARIWR